MHDAMRMVKYEYFVIFYTYALRRATITRSSFMNTLTTQPLAHVLDTLLAQSETITAEDICAATGLSAQVLEQQKSSKTGYKNFYARLKDFAIPVSRRTGELLYMLTRSSMPKVVVEFGTSFGISTLFIAAALRDNGGGQIITTEFEPSKVARAQHNLETAGLADLVEIRPGDALHTLGCNLPQHIDMLLLDGAKALYCDILKLAEPKLRPGALVFADDAGDSPEYMDYVRTPANGYMSLDFDDDVNLAVRLG